MIGGHLGNLQQGHYPININININNSKKEGDLFQRNSANVTTKGFAKRIYNINKGKSGLIYGNWKVKNGSSYSPNFISYPKKKTDNTSFGSFCSSNSIDKKNVKSRALLEDRKKALRNLQ